MATCSRRRDHRLERPGDLPAGSVRRTRRNGRNGVARALMARVAASRERAWQPDRRVHRARRQPGAAILLRTGFQPLPQCLTYVSRRTRALATLAAQDDLALGALSPLALAVEPRLPDHEGKRREHADQDRAGQHAPDMEQTPIGGRQRLARRAPPRGSGRGCAFRSKPPRSSMPRSRCRARSKSRSRIRRAATARWRRPAECR